MPAHPLWILADSSAKKSGGGGGFWLLVLASIVLMVVLFRRSQKTARRRATDMRSTIAVGSQVITTAGIHATVISTDDDTVDLEIADGVIVTFAKGAVSRVVSSPDDVEDDESGSDEVEEEPTPAEEQQGDEATSASES